MGNCRNNEICLIWNRVGKRKANESSDAEQTCLMDRANRFLCAYISTLYFNFSPMTIFTTIQNRLLSSHREHLTCFPSSIAFFAFVQTAPQFLHLPSPKSSEAIFQFTAHLTISNVIVRDADTTTGYFEGAGAALNDALRQTEESGVAAPLASTARPRPIALDPRATNLGWENSRKFRW